jgi:dTDP-4-dehydrorhamnose reductase
MKKIAVIGKNGQLAFELGQITTDDAIISCYGRDDIDITNTESLLATFKNNKINTVINAAAYTAVDLAETETQAAYTINAKAVENLAKVCKQLSLHLIHVSTDFVFQGDKGSPYLPYDIVNPIGVYAQSKAEGEKAVVKILEGRGCIIRCSWVYSVQGNNFLKTMLKLMETKTELGVICDQIGSPTSAKNLAKACLMAAVNEVSGIHHYTDAGVASWYDFAVAIQRLGIEQGLLSRRIKINPINNDEYPTLAKRPSYSVLDKKSMYEALPKLPVEHWEHALTETVKLLASSNRKVNA